MEARLDILKTAMQEDRTEVRLIKDKIYTVCTAITAFSFAVTTFLLDPKNPLGAIGWPFFLLIDISFLLLLWVLFARMKLDLDNAHKCLDAREDLIRHVSEETAQPFDPFPRVEPGRKPKIREDGLYWIVGTVSLVLTMKLVVVCTLLLGR